MFALVDKALAIAEKEVRTLRHDPVDLLARLVTPVLWLAVFGSVLSYRLVGRIEGASYQQFILPGVLIQNVLFTSIVYGITLKWEADLGILDKILSMPIPRASVVLGKALGTAVRALLQMAVVLALAAGLGVAFNLNPLAILASLAVVSILVIGFTSLSMIVAMGIGSREAFMGLVGIIVFPLFFLSNSLYPLEIMPDWIRTLSEGNPVTYAADFVRVLLVYGRVEVALLVDLLLVSGFSLAMVLGAVAMFRRRVA